VYTLGRWGDVQLYSQSLDQLAAFRFPALMQLAASSCLQMASGSATTTCARPGSKGAAAGGEPATICAAPGAAPGFRGATWGPNGTIVFSVAGYAGLMQVSDAGVFPSRSRNPPKARSI